MKPAPISAAVLIAAATTAALAGCSSSSTSACPTFTVKAKASSFLSVIGGINVVVPHVDVPVGPHISTEEGGSHGGTSDDEHGSGGSGSHLILRAAGYSVRAGQGAPTVGSFNGFDNDDTAAILDAYQARIPDEDGPDHAFF